MVVVEHTARVAVSSERSPARRAPPTWRPRAGSGSLAPDGAARELAIGFATGALLFAATLLAICAGASCAIDRGDTSAAAIALAWAIAAAVFEELAIRGILFRIAESSLGTWLALALSAAIFGALHGLNANATIVGCAAIAVEAGVLLAAAYVVTRRPWLPIGLHLAWNFTESGVFGASVSGTSLDGALDTRTSGPELLTGGTFGPEASLAAVALCLAVAVPLLVVARRRGGFVASAWRRR